MWSHTQLVMRGGFAVWSFVFIVFSCSTCPNQSVERKRRATAFANSMLPVRRFAHFRVRRLPRPVPRDCQVAHVIARDCCVYFTVVWVTPFIASRTVLTTRRECVTARPFPPMFALGAVEVTPTAPNHGMQRTRAGLFSCYVFLFHKVAGFVVRLLSARVTDPDRSDMSQRFPSSLRGSA